MVYELVLVLCTGVRTRRRT